MFYNDYYAFFNNNSFISFDSTNVHTITKNE